ncbi:MAG: hypothetical protein FJY44_02575 [Betaproteobacteria bacterium]|nr:hypothetical protein [Betaproteobacteria bacterium]
MTDIDAVTRKSLPSQDLITLTHIVYALHAFSAISGLTSAALIVTAFLTGWPSIIAVIINYVKRDSVRGTFLDTHFSWQIRTFWWSLLWLVIAGLMIATFIGMVIGIPILFAAGIWILYRIIRGWLNLLSRKAMPMPD